MYDITMIVSHARHVCTKHTYICWPHRDPIVDIAGDQEVSTFVEAGAEICTVRLKSRSAKDILRYDSGLQSICSLKATYSPLRSSSSRLSEIPKNSSDLNIDQPHRSKPAAPYLIQRL